MASRRLGELLIAAGLVTAEDWDTVSREEAVTGTSAVLALLARGVNSERIARVIHEAGVEHHAATRLENLSPELLEHLPRKVSLRYVALPVAVRDDLLSVVLADPFDPLALQTLTEVTGHRIEVGMADPRRLALAIDRYHGSALTPSAGPEGGDFPVPPLPPPDEDPIPLTLRRSEGSAEGDDVEVLEPAGGELAELFGGPGQPGPRLPGAAIPLVRKRETAAARRPPTPREAPPTLAPVSPGTLPPPPAMPEPPPPEPPREAPLPPAALRAPPPPPSWRAAGPLSPAPRPAPVAPAPATSETEAGATSLPDPATSLEPSVAEEIPASAPEPLSPEDRDAPSAEAVETDPANPSAPPEPIAAALARVELKPAVAGPAVADAPAMRLETPRGLEGPDVKEDFDFAITRLRIAETRDEIGEAAILFLERCFPRAALISVRGRTISGWLSGGEFLPEQVDVIRIEGGQPSLLWGVIDSGKPFIGPLPPGRETLIELMITPPRQLAAFPVVLGERTVALLYGDTVDERPMLARRDLLERLAEELGDALGHLILQAKTEG